MWFCFGSFRWHGLGLVETDLPVKAYIMSPTPCKVYVKPLNQTHPYFQLSEAYTLKSSTFGNLGLTSRSTPALKWRTVRMQIIFWNFSRPDQKIKWALVGHFELHGMALQIPGIAVKRVIFRDCVLYWELCLA